MARRITYEKYLNTLAERTIDNTKLLKRDLNQRRNGMEDLYGQPFIVNGDATNPATFYISISPDFIYLERFAFKFVIQPFTTTVTGATDSVAVTVDNRNLAIEDGAINPNPHNHTTRPHTHTIIDGMAFVPTTSTDWHVKIAGVDISEYLEEQVDPDDWLGARGEGVYPNENLSEETGKVNFYDILDVAAVLDALGKTDERNALLKPELKRVEISSNAPFGIQAYLYLKYSHLNR